MSAEIFEIHVSGRFRLVAADGSEVPISSAKVQAILALLAVDKQMTRSRLYLQNKLWSSRSIEMKSVSLRQALYQVRKALGDGSDILTANRNLVALDPKRIKLHRDESGEFLEGLNVRDPAFEVWLLDQRAQPVKRPADPSYSRPEHTPRTSTLVYSSPNQFSIECVNDIESSLGQQEIQWGDLIQKSVREILDHGHIRTKIPVGDGETHWTLGIQAYSDAEDRTGLRLALYEGVSRTSSWADSVTGPASRGGQSYNSNFLNLCHRATRELVERLCGSTFEPGAITDPNAIANAGLRCMYSMLPGSIEQSKKLFKRAYKIRPRGLFQALQAQLAVIEYVESGGKDRLELSERADEMCVKALADEGNNSNVLSFVAHSRLVFDGDKATSTELSRLAVLTNPTNPLAWSTLANVLINTGRTEDAVLAAQRASDTSRDTFLRYWTEFQYATMAVAMKDFSTAIQQAERARALNPRYRPALRYLVGLYAKTGDFEGARLILQRLKRLEPDISTDRFINDDTYPVTMMRKMGLLEADKLKDL